MLALPASLELRLVHLFRAHRCCPALGQLSLGPQPAVAQPAQRASPFYLCFDCLQRPEEALLGCRLSASQQGKLNCSPPGIQGRTLRLVWHALPFDMPTASLVLCVSDVVVSLTSSRSMLDRLCSYAVLGSRPEAVAPSASKAWPGEMFPMQVRNLTPRCSCRARSRLGMAFAHRLQGKR